MRQAGIVLLVVALAGGAFFLGTRYRPAAPAPAITPAATPAAIDAVAAAKREQANSALPDAQPTRTYRGPDGRPHLINYGSTPLDDTNPALVREAVLADMRNHPRNIEESYDLPLADIEAIVAGSKPYPDAMLPAPAAPARVQSPAH